MIEFTRATYDDVVHHAYRGGDEEICGVLAGTRGSDGDASTVVRTYETENVAERPRIRYRLDPEEQLAVIETIEEDGLDVVGFYHSHPTGPTRPSETDVARATWHGYSYVICALDGYPFVGSWRFRGDEGGFDREPVAVSSDR